MKGNIKGIKTEFKGQEFKSRLEANMAQILGLMDHNWEYEPKSFLLNNGEHYQPDFFVPELNLWIETRGYSSEKGNKQLRGFRSELSASREKHKKFVENGGIVDEYTPDFLIVGPKKIDFYEDTRRFGGVREPETWVSRCVKCESFFFYDLGGHYQCRNCGGYDGDHHLGKSCAISFKPQKSQIVTMKHGYLGTSHKGKRLSKLRDWLKEIKSDEG